MLKDKLEVDFCLPNLLCSMWNSNSVGIPKLKGVFHENTPVLGSLNLFLKGELQFRAKSTPKEL